MFVVKRLFDIEKPTPPLGFFESWPPPHCNLLRRCIIDGEGSSMFWAWFNYLPDSLCFTPHSFWCCCCSTKLDPLFYILLQKFFKNLFLQSCSWWGCINLFLKTYFRNRSYAIALKVICLFHRAFQNWINKTEVVNPYLSTNKQQCKCAKRPKLDILCKLYICMYYAYLGDETSLRVKNFLSVITETQKEMIIIAAACVKYQC